MSTGLTARLAAYIATCGIDQLDPAARAVAVTQVMDGIACILAGVAAPRVAGAIALADRLEGPAPEGLAVPVIGTDLRGNAPAAAFAMAAACHALEYDDGNREGSIHPGAVVVPAALAVAYRENRSLGQMLDAILGGYEISVTAAEVMNPGAMQRGFQPTPVTGTLGAAAATARLLGLDAARVESAIGIAASASAGTFAYLAGGGDIKKLHPANAARAGIQAGYAAEAGLAQGPRAVLEGPRALFSAYAGLDEGSGRREIGGALPAICRGYLKPYPCCRHVHSAIEALLQVVTDNDIAADQIAAIEVETYAAAMAHAPLPWDTFEVAQLSFPYLMAVTAAHRQVTIADFDAQYRDSPTLADLAGRVAIREAADLTARYPAQSPARVRVLTRSGARAEAMSRFPPGSREAPMTDAAFAAKFAECAGRAPGLGDPGGLLGRLSALPPDTPVRQLVDDLLVPGA